MADVQLQDQGAIIKAAYEAEPDTNAFTDAEKTKLAGLSGGGASNADNLLKYIFIASDTTGATDMSAEFEAAMLATGGETLYIPEGSYFFKSANVAGDVNVVASPRAIFLNEYTEDDDARTIRQRNAESAGSAIDILDIDNIIWFFSENTTRIRVADASVFARDDIVHIHSQNGFFQTDLTEGTDIRRVGQSGKIAEVDTVNDYIYLYGALEYVPLLVTNPKIRKYSTRKFSWDGGIFRAKDTSVLFDPTNNDQGFRRPCIEIYATPETKIKNVHFEYNYGQAIMLRSCPYSVIENCTYKGSPNIRLPTEPYTGRTGTFSSGSTAVTVSSTSNSSIAVGKSISGTGIQSGTYIAAYSHPNLTLSQPTTAAGSGVTLSVESKYFITGISQGTLVFQNGTTTTGSTVITMTDTTGMAAGMEVSGTGIVPNSFILAVSAGVSITINEACTASGTVTVTGYPGLVIAVSAIDTLANNDVVMFDGVGGMTELNNRFFQVTGKSGLTFKIYDYFGGGAINPSSSSQYRLASGRGWGTYTSGGTARETGSGDTSLAYGVQLYAASCFSIIKNCKFHQLRHGVTSDGISGGTYSATEWPNYGHPCKVTVVDCYSWDSNGVPFDTHQEGLNWTFLNCHSVNANRGPFFQTSYSGTGFQDRSGSTSFINCSAVGGVRGFRISKADNMLASEGRLINCSVVNNRSLQDEDGIGVIFTPEVRGGPFPTRYLIKDLMITGCGTGIETGTASSNSDAGASLELITNGLFFTGTKVGFDVTPNTLIRHLGKVGYDTTGSKFTGDHYICRMRSASALTRSGDKVNGSAVISGLSATSDLYVGMYVNGSGVPSFARIKSIDSSSQITLNVNCYKTETSNITISRTSTHLFMDGLNIVEDHEHPVKAIFYQSDTNGTKYYSLPSGSTRVASSGIRYKEFTNSDINTGTDTITVTALGFTNRDEVRLKLVSGTFPSGPSQGTTYYILIVDANNFRLYTDKALTSIVDITAAGSGTFSVQAIPMIFTNNTTNTFAELPDFFTL